MENMIHRFEHDGVYFILDVASGCVHLPDRLTYELAGELEKSGLRPDSGIPPELPGYSSDEAAEAYTELRGLYEQGMLFSDEGPAVARSGAVPVKAMCLNVAHDCNMRCRYCFAGTGDFGGGRALMSRECARAALDFLLERSGSIRNLEVDFFGGEPLMNMDVVRDAVRYGRSRAEALGKYIRFTLTTNGALLDAAAIGFINADIDNIVLSLDGRPGTNDSMREFADGSGTYGEIVPRYRALVAARGAGERGEYYVRGTFTRANLDFWRDVLWLADLGFENISVEPVVLPASDPLSLRMEDLPEIRRSYDILVGELLKRARCGEPVNFFHFNIDLEAGPCAYKRIKGCGSGSEYIAVTPDGSVYPCHQFVGTQGYILGNVLTGMLFDTARQADFAGRNITTMPECRDCWAKYYCGGGCAANNLSQNGALDKPYALACEMERYRVQCALYLAAETGKTI